ncbi:NOF-FB transposable element protein, partial [Aphis craccivora]
MFGSKFNAKNQQNNNEMVSESAENKALENWNRKVDSLISILASSAADSIHFRNYLDEMETSNLTAKLALQLITKKNTKQIYHTRLSLLLQFFADKTETLVGGLKWNNCVQTEIEEYMKNIKALCVYCGNERDSVIETTSHIIVELNSIPKILKNSTSITDIENVPLDLSAMFQEE